MADSRKIVRVFLASAGDLRDERLAAKSVVDGFNSLWADQLGYHVELVAWEETVSRFGRPQALINQDLERCELFVGMMWTEWGSPPDTEGGYTSGFEEEFETALALRTAHGRPEMSLLFKKVDARQERDPGVTLKKVLDFKKRISEEKILLYEAFHTLRDFEDRFERIVTRYVQSLWAAEETEESRQAQLPPSSETGASSDDALLPAQTLIFLKEFVASAEKSRLDGIGRVEVARLRLVSATTEVGGNDTVFLGAHDANVIFSRRSDFAAEFRSQVKYWAVTAAKNYQLSIIEITRVLHASKPPSIFLGKKDCTRNARLGKAYNREETNILPRLCLCAKQAVQRSKPLKIND